MDWLSLRIFSELHLLDLYWNGVHDEGADALANSPYLVRLRELRLDYNPVTNQGLEALWSSQYLRQCAIFD